MDGYENTADYLYFEYQAFSVLTEVDVNAFIVALIVPDLLISHLHLSFLVFLDRLHEIDFNFATKDPMQTLGVLKVPKLEPVDRETYLEDLWEKSYKELAAYKNHFGHCNIPISYEANPSLGAWAFSQRMAHKKDKLSQDRIEKLNEVGFSFGPQKKVVEV